MTDEQPEPTGRPSKAERLAKVHDRAMHRFDAIWAVVKDERAQNLADRRFATVRGAQWEGQYAVGDPDDDEPSASPRMEVPKFLRAIRRVRGEYRAARKTVDFKPKGDAGDREADNLDGLYRADEHDTPGGGQLAYANAFDEGIAGGIGAWRLRARYEDEEDGDNDRQRIAIEPIYDADRSVFFDLDAKAQDKSDARFGFILFTLTRDAFEERHPDASPTTFTDPQSWTYDWTRPDTITLAEYFEVEDRSVLRRTYRQTILENVEDEPEERTYDDADLTAERDGEMTLEKELKATGWTEVRSRRIKRQRVRKYLLSGAECLDDEGEVPGRYIPVIQYSAERAYIEGVERTAGMVRPVIDSTRIYNLTVSQVAEAAAGPTDDTPIVAPDQVVGGLLADWATRKVKRPAALLLHPILGDNGEILQAGLSGTLPAAQISTALAALIQIAGADVAELSGMQDRVEAVPANTSGFAIEMANDRADVNDFLWQDNFGVAMEHSGRVWLEMARELYVEPGREMEARDADGGKSVVTLAEKRLDGEGGDYVRNDLANGRYDVEVDVGPATKTKRDATVRASVGIAGAYTANGNVGNANAALGIAVLNMDGEGLDGLKAMVRKQGLSEGWVEPSEEEAAELAEQAQAAGQQPDPAILLAQAQVTIAQAEMAKAETGRIEAETRRLAAEANAESARANAAAALAKIDQADRAQILAEVRAEVDSDRADRAQVLAEVDATTRVERHDHDLMESAHGDGS